MNRYAVVMAGGDSTRFWPFSRQDMPKHMLQIYGDDLMVNQSIKRVMGVIVPENVFVITGKKQYEIAGKLITGEIPRDNILLEPVKRNTAACIAYAALAIESRNSEGVMCILPSDHYIDDRGKFRETLLKAFEAAEGTGKLITIGIKPSFPSTGYGYIRYKPDGTSRSDGAFEVEEFIEKPCVDRAREYINSKCHIWNSGIFVWKVSSILESLERFLPKLFKAMCTIRPMIAAGLEQVALEQVYAGIQNISIDYGVLERSDDILVIPGEFQWSDVGSWDVLGASLPRDEKGNVIRAIHIGLSTSNSIIFGHNRLIATIGIDNLIIADTDDALLICPKDYAQDVKKIVELIRSKGLDSYL